MKQIRQSIGLVFLALMMTSCGTFVDTDRVARAVEKQGYRDVKITRKHIFFIAWRGCGKDDDAAFKATALNATGQQVDLTACAGWPFKGVTVRTN